jgi:hypothetical protein
LLDNITPKQALLYIVGDAEGYALFPCEKDKLDNKNLIVQFALKEDEFWQKRYSINWAQRMTLTKLFQNNQLIRTFWATLA